MGALRRSPLLPFARDWGWVSLPRFVERRAGSARAPGTLNGSHGALSILSQDEIRRTERVRLFIDFVSQRPAEYAPRLLGSLPEVALTLEPQ